MKLKILSSGKQEKGTIDLPMQFSEKFEPDLIKRAVLATLANKRQRYGVDPRAGKKQEAKLSKRRRKYKGVYGHGISRTPRKIMSRSGTQFRWKGAFAPQTVGGRKSHPPKAEKIWAQKINKKERRKAIRSAISATLMKSIVAQRGHLIPENYPFAADSRIESISKTGELLKAVENLGFEKELERTNNKKIRAGKGKNRGRKYAKVRGMLVVVSENCPSIISSNNIPGLEFVEVRKLSAEMLAPGAAAGRMTVFTDRAIALIEKDRLFTDNQVKKEKPEAKEEKPKKKPAVKTEAKPKKKLRNKNG